VSVIIVNKINHSFIFHFSLGKWYFDTGFFLISIWHSDVAVSSCVAKKEKHRWFSAYVVHVCLFAKGVFCHLSSEKCRAIWEGKADLIFSLHSLTPHALEEREQRKQRDLRSFCKIHVPSARFAFLFPTVEALPFALVVLTLNPKLFLVWNMLVVSRCLLRLGFRVCSYDLVLLASYACMRKMRSCCVMGC